MSETRPWLGYRPWLDVRKVDPMSLLGRQVQMFNGQGDDGPTGEVIAYTDKPTIVIRYSDGTQTSWILGLGGYVIEEDE